VNATLKVIIKQVNEKLLFRKKELFDQNLKRKTWASNEITFVDQLATKVEVIIRETEQIFLVIMMLKAVKEK
jgi:hypothetical protein